RQSADAVNAVAVKESEGAHHPPLYRASPGVGVTSLGADDGLVEEATGLAPTALPALLGAVAPGLAGVDPALGGLVDAAVFHRVPPTPSLRRVGRELNLSAAGFVFSR